MKRIRAASTIAAPTESLATPRAPALAPGAAARLATLAASALLLVWPAFWNGYPLVFADTGTYLGQALIGYLGWDRPPFYSIFLLLTGWRVSLWLPVLAQGLILAHLLSLVLRVQGLGAPRHLLVAAAALAVLTGLPWFAAQLIPDVFTGALVLAVWLLAFRAAALTPAERWWLLLLSTGAVAVHQSHLPLALGLALVALLLLGLARGWRAARPAAPRLLGPPLLAALAIASVNLAGHGRFSVSPFGSVFLAARVIADGPGLAYLRAACPNSGYSACRVLDRLGPEHNRFLWEPDSPLHNELGGPKAWAPEAASILRGTFAADPLGEAAAMAENALRQFVLLGTGDGLIPWPAVPGPAPLIARFYPQESAAYAAARQQHGTLLPLAESLSPLHVATAGLGFLALVLLLVLRGRRMTLPAVALALLVLAAAAGNAAITGALSGPAERYQARLAWLIAFAPALLIARPREAA